MDETTERFYAFERACRARFEPDNPRDDFPGCIDAIHIAFATANVTPHIVFSFGIGRTTGGCSKIADGLFEIALPPKRRRLWCALHEAAHVMTWGAGHGREFARLVIDLWVIIGKWPSCEIDQLAAEHGVLTG